MKYIQTLTEKGKLKWQDSDAPDANGRFRDLSPKDLAAWLIKTRKGDMKKISGSLSQQVAFNKNDDPEYAKKMDKTRIEVYKQMDREDLLESVDMDDLENAKEQLSNPHTILDITYDKTRRGDKFVRFDYENKYVPGKMLDTGPHFVNVRYDNNKDLKKISKELNMDLKESVLNEEDTWNDYPAAAKKNAQKAIDWKEKYGRDEVDAGTPVGWARAHQLAKGENLSTDTVKRMSAFNRHRKNSSIKPELKETPWKDRGYVAWLIWGGDEGVDWAIEKSKEIDAMKESKQMKYIKPLDEIKRSMISGTSGRTIDSLEDRKYELKKDVEGARIGDYTNITLPKGTIIYNLPGGVMADHKSLKRYADRNNNIYFEKPTFSGISIRQMPDTLAAIEKNGKVLESVNEAKMPTKYIGNDDIVFLKTKEDSRGAQYNLYYKGHDIEAGGARFGSEKELEDFASNYILSNQWYKKLRYEDSIPLPEAFVGPFVFNDKMSDDELKAMYNGALDGYSYYAKGMQYSKSDYKKAYQEIEKILNKRGVDVNEAKLSTVHRAAKKGSYPAVIVVVQDGKVIHQEPVSTPDVAPATFNVMQKEYPKALLHLEDKTGKRLFSESVTEGIYAKKSKIQVGEYIKTQYGYFYKRVEGKVGGQDAYVEIKKGKEGKRKTSIHDTVDFDIVDKDTAFESVVTERLARGLKPLLTLGSTITKKVGEDALLDLSDKFDRIDDEYAGTIASWLDMAIELMQDGYAGDATKKLKQFNKACKDVLNGKDIGSAFESVVTEGMSKSAIKKAIKVIDQQIEDEEGGDGEPLDNETLQALEQERERLLKMNESKFSPLGYAKRVISGEISLKAAMKEAGISFKNISKLIKQIDKSFDLDAAIAENRKYIKTLNEGYWSHYDYEKWTKENGKPKYPKWIKVTLKEIVKGGFMESHYDAEHMYMVLWLGSLETKRRSELYAYDSKGKKEFGKVGYAMYQRFYNDLTGYNMFFMQGALYALEVSKHIQDRIANGEPVEPAYYMMKEYFNGFGMKTDRSRVFNAAYEKLEKWMKDNQIKTL